MYDEESLQALAQYERTINEKADEIIAKSNYEHYSKIRKNFSESADIILEKIKDGYDPNRADVFELMSEDLELNEKFRKFYDLQKDVCENGSLEEQDLLYLIDTLGVDKETGDLLYNEFKKHGKIR